MGGDGARCQLSGPIQFIARDGTGSRGRVAHLGSSIIPALDASPPCARAPSFGASTGCAPQSDEQDGQNWWLSSHRTRNTFYLHFYSSESCEQVTRDENRQLILTHNTLFCTCILTGTLVSVLERPHSFIVSPSTLLARLARLCRPLLDASSSSASLLLLLSTNPSLNNASNARCLL